MFNIDLDESFNKYIYESEGCTLRVERFLDDVEYANQTIMLTWLKAAFKAGAEAMAKDTLDTLADYSTATAGCHSIDIYEIARESLEEYYKDVL